MTGRRSNDAMRHRRRAVIGLGLLLALSLTPRLGQTAERGPNLASVHGVVAPIADGETLHAKHADVAVPIASLTKLMTALVVMESGQPLDEWLTVVGRDNEPPANAYTRIREGSRLQRRELLRLALMSSENMAAHVLASHHPDGRDGFIEAMNATAKRLGMADSQFVDPSGLSTRNRSSASDMLRLARAAHAHARIREYSTTTYQRARFRSPRYALEYGNTNPLVAYEGWPVSLSKTGYLDDAGRCLVMVTRIEGRQIAMVLLNSLGTRSPLGDAGRIRRWIRTGAPGTVAAAARRHAERESERYD